MSRRPLLGSLLLSLGLLATPAPAFAAHSIPQSDDPPGWAAFLQEAKHVTKESQVGRPGPDPAAVPPRLAAKLERAVVLVPPSPSKGLSLAIADLTTYLTQVTGQPVAQLPWNAQVPANTVAVAVGQGEAVKGLIAPPSGRPEGYTIESGTTAQGGPLVSLNGDDATGQQYAVYRFMALSGQRFLNYMDPYTPPVGQAVYPKAGFRERWAPTDQMKVRGFSPHMYHPIPLSIAFHEPSEKNLGLVKRYIDWLVANRQNYFLAPMLEVNPKNPYLPIIIGEAGFEAWVPHAQAIVAHAKARGVKIGIKVAFANYVSANPFAVPPFEALGMSNDLNGLRTRRLELQARAKALRAERDALDAAMVAEPAKADELSLRRGGLIRRIEALDTEAGTLQDAYDKALGRHTATSRTYIVRLIDKLMRAPWDEVTWHMGTSEFTPTNDDLTIAWMREADSHLKGRYPGVRMVVRSHVPARPWSDAYGDSYFHLMRFAPPSVGVLVHTTHSYALTDPAPVYGNQDFLHKLKFLYRQDPARLNVYYPETSYWVAHDASVPLFLPLYILNRKQDMAIVRKVPHLDGHATFTTAWEWGYWLNDYACARMQAEPDLSVRQILDDALAPYGAARPAIAEVLLATMKVQQDYLIGQNGFRHVQGFDPLTDFGAFAHEHPLLGQVLEGTNSTPLRLRASTLMGWDLDTVHEFEHGELAELAAFERQCEVLLAKTEAIAPQVPAAGQRFYAEVRDGMRINHLRTRQARLAKEAVVLARKSELLGDPGLKAQGREAFLAAEKIVDEAMTVIRAREPHYRDEPAYTTDRGHTKTLWGDRYLTRVSTGMYWKNTVEEIARYYR